MLGRQETQLRALRKLRDLGAVPRTPRCLFFLCSPSPRAVMGSPPTPARQRTCVVLAFQRGKRGTRVWSDFPKVTQRIVAASPPAPCPQLYRMVWPPRCASQESLEKPVERKLSPAGSGRDGGSVVPPFWTQSSCTWV